MSFTEDQIERYARHILLKEIGGTGQQTLMAARVLIVGAGGLGSPLGLYLAAAGVGTLGVADFDHVELSNLQRQIAHGTADLGTPKTASMAGAIAALNPDVTVQCHEGKLDAARMAAVLADYDIIADGSDNYTTRAALNRACLAARKPLVSGAVRRFEGQLTTFRGWEQTKPCYQCLWPDAPQTDRDSCADEGILGAVAGVIGTAQAVEVIKEILGLGESLAGRLSLYDALSGRWRLVQFGADPACSVCAPVKEKAA